MLYATLNSAEPHDARAALLAEECALAISYNGLNHAVMMVTPQDLEEFVVGFSLAGGLIERLDELRDLRLLGDGSARRADVQVSPRAFWTLKQQRRQLALPGADGGCRGRVDALDRAGLGQVGGQAILHGQDEQRLVGLRRHQVLERLVGLVGPELGRLDGVNVGRVSSREPTLEDAYVELVSATPTAGDPAGDPSDDSEGSTAGVPA